MLPFTVPVPARRAALAVALAAAVGAMPAPLHAQDAMEVASGAQVWASNCTRCHNARPSQERTDAQWLTIVLHMRARANLTRTQARLVTSFMQATNVPEGVVAPVVAPEEAAEPLSVDSGVDGVEMPPQTAERLRQVIRYLRVISVP